MEMNFNERIESKEKAHSKEVTEIKLKHDEQIGKLRSEFEGEKQALLKDMEHQADAIKAELNKAKEEEINKLKMMNEKMMKTM